MSTSEQINVVAILKPKPGKMDRCKEVISQLADDVHKSEPDALRYQLHVEVKDGQEGDEIYIFEQYKTLAAFEAHRETAHYTKMQKTAGGEDLVAHLVVRMLKPIGGFASK